MAAGKATWRPEMGLSGPCLRIFEPARNWPVNEVVLLNLVLRGRSDAQIAQIYKVPMDEVTALRKYFEL
jgi:hypothetical protein